MIFVLHPAQWCSSQWCNSSCTCHTSTSLLGCRRLCSTCPLSCRVWGPGKGTSPDSGCRNYPPHSLLWDWDGVTLDLMWCSVLPQELRGSPEGDPARLLMLATGWQSRGLVSLVLAAASLALQAVGGLAVTDLTVLWRPTTVFLQCLSQVTWTNNRN